MRSRPEANVNESSALSMIDSHFQRVKQQKVYSHGGGGGGGIGGGGLG